MKEKDLWPVPLAILAKCHVSGGKQKISDLAAWLEMSDQEVVATVMAELKGFCKIDGDMVTGKIKPSKTKTCQLKCPHDKITALWNTITEGVLPKVVIWLEDSPRHKALEKRWAEVVAMKEADTGQVPTEVDILMVFERMFRYVMTRDILTGRVKNSNGRPPFKADLEWCMRPESFQNIFNMKHTNNKGERR